MRVSILNWTQWISGILYSNDSRQSATPILYSSRVGITNELGEFHIMFEKQYAACAIELFSK